LNGVSTKIDVSVCACFVYLSNHMLGFVEWNMLASDITVELRININN